LTFTLSGLSKISALPQMKLAWIHVSGPGDDRNQALERLEVIADLYLSVSTPIQLAAGIFFAQQKSVQAQLMRRVERNLAELDRQLDGQKSCTRLLAEGGWYAVLSIPCTALEEDFSIELLRRASVLVHPGYLYDFADGGYLVLSLIVPEKDFKKGVAALIQLANVGF
jgi:aspartate/methionine/tyrosine aminotransferase